MGLGVNIFLQTEIDGRVRAGVEQVITFVLRVVHAEMVLDVFGQRMHLERQMATAHRVEKIEADGKFIAESRVNRVTKQLAWLVKHQINRGNFKPRAAE